MQKIGIYLLACFLLLSGCNRNFVSEHSQENSSPQSSMSSEHTNIDVVIQNDIPTDSASTVTKSNKDNVISAPAETLFNEEEFKNYLYEFVPWFIEPAENTNQLDKRSILCFTLYNIYNKGVASGIEFNISDSYFVIPTEAVQDSVNQNFNIFNFEYEDEYLYDSLNNNYLFAGYGVPWVTIEVLNINYDQHENIVIAQMNVQDKQSESGVKKLSYNFGVCEKDNNIYYQLISINYLE